MGLLELLKSTTKNPAMLKCLDMALKVAQTDAHCLIVGESGSGKELIARLIHEKSGKNGPFVAVDCGAIVETLVESELFGHEKGAFTGADQRKKGRFELANNGTVFLDEISNMSKSAQAKMLRAIEYHEFTRVGGEEVLSFNSRIIAATNVPLEDLVQEGTFRKDLYYRLNEIRIAVPPLRERKEDIPLILEHFLREYESSEKAKKFSDAAINCLLAYSWPGNVRELRSVVRRALTMSERDTVWIEDLGLRVSFTGTPDSTKPRDLTIDEVDRAHIVKVLRITGGNKAAAARLLGLSRPGLDKMMKRLGITLDDAQQQ